MAAFVAGGGSDCEGVVFCFAFALDVEVEVIRGGELILALFWSESVSLMRRPTKGSKQHDRQAQKHSSG